jgi:hypothetical protein
MFSVKFCVHGIFPSQINIYFCMFNAYIDTHSAIFLKKIGSAMRSVTKNSVGEGMC